MTISCAQHRVVGVLARVVEQRQRRQLSTAFQSRQAVFSRVSGRIDHLTTQRPRRRSAAVEWS